MIKSRRRFCQISVLGNNNVVFQQTHQIVAFDQNYFFFRIFHKFSLSTITFKVRLITLCIFSLRKKNAITFRQGIEKRRRILLNKTKLVRSNSSFQRNYLIRKNSNDQRDIVSVKWKRKNKKIQHSGIQLSAFNNNQLHCAIYFLSRRAAIL